MANRYCILPAATTSLWSATSTWSDSSGGATGASVPTSADNVYVDANSVAGAAAILSIDATAYCLDMDWTGATNTPTFAGGSIIEVYGSVTFIAAMNYTQSGYFRLKSTASGKTVTTNGQTLTCSALSVAGVGGGWTLQDAVTTTGAVYIYAGTLDTNGKTLICTTFEASGSTTRDLTLGASVINCTTWTVSGSDFTLTANTSTINVSGTGAFVGGAITTYNNINLNGTAHTVSGAFTCAILTRNGTATKTDTVTFTSGVTVTCTTFAMIGNSATNRLLVQSSTLGTAATITATNWTGTANIDLMDITATNAINLSAITGLSGDCGGNTGIIFTTGAAQTWDGSTGSWSGMAKWTSRVPLAQDDVSAGGAGNTITVDMPRIGKSITFTGTPTVTKSMAISWYGSLTFVSGMTYTTVVALEIFCGRGSFNLTSAGKVLYCLYVRAPGGTLTLQDNLVSSSEVPIYHEAGTLDLNDKNTTAGQYFSATALPRTLRLRRGTFTLNRPGQTLWYVLAGLTIDAGTSTIVLTNSGAAAQTFAGAGFTYYNVTIAGAGNYALIIYGSNTFNILKVDRSVAAKTIRLTSGTNQQVANLVITPVGTRVVTINASTGGSVATMTKLGSQHISLDYLHITDSIVALANTWYAGANSTNGGGNTGWVFAAPAKRGWWGK